MKILLGFNFIIFKLTIGFKEIILSKPKLIKNYC